MSLHLKVNLLFAAWIAALIMVVLWMHVAETRRAVGEEIRASNRIATQLLETVVAATRVGRDIDDLVRFLEAAGRIRSTEARVLDASGGVLYASPPSPYKAGRDAPAWYARLVMPEAMHERFLLPDGVLEVSADASRSILDGWDQAVELATVGAGFLALGIALMVLLLRRATAPLRQIVGGLEQFERGAWETRLPMFGNAEADLIARAFNRMGAAVQENLGAREEAIAATLRLRQSRETATVVQARLEDERRQIARELHDETSQGLTAIRSMSLALARRGGDPEQARRAQLIADSAAGLHAAVHALIPRLQSTDFDGTSLADALDEQVALWRQQYPETVFELCVEEGSAADLPAERALAAHRIVQEAAINALRHAGARRIALRVTVEDAALLVEIVDDGRGLPADWHRPGHYGIRGMRERAEALGGGVEIESGHRGVRVRARLPLQARP
ncbi:ATP-binding protein [Coralloluteibacterium stylophorae]|uniref:histidine kinase n=2 Tax=Coralloluteibacterium stylophorae TaxID=1776034 RepID=A0AAP2FXS5_9GAMM|nr:ATP-binding protein [Coralloluteibacterium stylophorae]MBS7456614.1 HAMP domain-containing protein [Coralloluteibacterium stylophorae]